VTCRPPRRVSAGGIDSRHREPSDANERVLHDRRARQRYEGPFTSDSLPSFNGVDPSFFTVMRMRLIDGRLFTDDENRKGARSVAVITTSMRVYFWPSESAVASVFTWQGEATLARKWSRRRDARLFPSIRPTTQGASVLPADRASIGRLKPGTTRAHCRDPANVLQTLRQEAQAAAPGLPYVDAHAFDDVFQALLRPWRLGSTVFVSLARCRCHRRGGPDGGRGVQRHAPHARDRDPLCARRRASPSGALILRRS